MPMAIVTRKIAIATRNRIRAIGAQFEPPRAAAIPRLLRGPPASPSGRGSGAARRGGHPDDRRARALGDRARAAAGLGLRPLPSRALGAPAPEQPPEPRQRP